MKLEFSAGGVVFKKEQDSIWILVSKHSFHKGWVFPKGLIGDHVEGEKKEDTAVREVKEETGIDAEILSELTPVEYWYSFEGEKRKKTVYYYIMKYMGGNFDDRDDEMEDVEWLPMDQVMRRLSYPSDKKVFEEARPIIQRLVDSV